LYIKGLGLSVIQETFCSIYSCWLIYQKQIKYVTMHKLSSKRNYYWTIFMCNYQLKSFAKFVILYGNW